MGDKLRVNKRDMSDAGGEVGNTNMLLRQLVVCDPTMLDLGKALVKDLGELDFIGGAAGQAGEAGVKGPFTTVTDEATEATKWLTDKAWIGKDKEEGQPKRYAQVVFLCTPSLVNLDGEQQKLLAAIVAQMYAVWTTVDFVPLIAEISAAPLQFERIEQCSFLGAVKRDGTGINEACYRRSFRFLVQRLTAPKGLGHEGEQCRIRGTLPWVPQDSTLAQVCVEKYCERPWLEEEVAAWIMAEQQAGDNIMWIKGGLGSGKSAFTAHLALRCSAPALRCVAAYHFSSNTVGVCAFHTAPVGGPQANVVRSTF